MPETATATVDMVEQNANRVRAYAANNDVVLVEKYGTHYYRRPGTFDFPSVTGILGTLNKGGLAKWAVNQTIAEIRKVLQESYRHETDKTMLDLSEDELDKVLESARGAADRVRDDAAAFGSLVHLIIERYAMTGGVPPLPEHGGKYDNPDNRLTAEQMEEAVLQARLALQYVRDQHLIPVACEVPIFMDGSNTAGLLSPWPTFGGTIDMVCVHSKTGDIRILDWKTSKEKYDIHKYQVAAYAVALNSALRIGGNSGVQRAAVMYTKRNEVVNAEIGGDFMAFVNVARAWDSTHKSVDLFGPTQKPDADARAAEVGIRA